MSNTLPKIAFFSGMGWGGTEKVVVNLLQQLVKYPISLDLVVPKKHEQYFHLHDIPAQVRVVELKNAGNSRLKQIFPLMQYLRQEKPQVLVSHLTQYNVIAPMARMLTRFPHRLILVEHLSFRSLEEPLKNNLREKVALVKFLRHVFYDKADVVAAVSESLAQELEATLRLKPEKIKVLYNPVVDETLLSKAQAPLDHPWFQPGQPPVFLGVGRLTAQKDFTALVHAFSILREHQEARLVILGEGEERENLQAKITQRNLEEDVLLPGYTDNPFSYMSRASAFVLSSQFEGLPTVLIEALACGCQVVSTDCPYGPREILRSGEYGHLVPVSDIYALADAMKKIVSNPFSSEKLKARAMDFSVEKSTSKYLDLMNIRWNSLIDRKEIFQCNTSQ